MQTLIELITTNDEIFIINQIIDNEHLILSLCLHPHGSHVIKKIIQFFPESKREVVNHVVDKNFVSLSLNMYGICVLKIFLFSNICFKIRKTLLKNLTDNIVHISTNSFGNYVLQFAMQVFNYNNIIVLAK
jgi:hypothetical protein